MAYYQNWDLRPLLAIYWCQSVIIGVFNFMRMIRLKNFWTEGFTSNGEPMPETSQGKSSTAIFFAFSLRLLSRRVPRVRRASRLRRPGASTFGGLGNPMASICSGWWWVWCVSRRPLVLVPQHAEADLAGRPNMGTMMFLPYARMVPIHLTIILGFWMGSNRARSCCSSS